MLVPRVGGYVGYARDMEEAGQQEPPHEVEGQTSKGGNVGTLQHGDADVSMYKDYQSGAEDCPVVPDTGVVTPLSEDPEDFPKCPICGELWDGAVCKSCDYEPDHEYGKGID